MDNPFELIKQSVPFRAVAGHYGIEFDRSSKAPCPFHEDETPSFSLHPSGEFAWCFGCDAWADVIELEFKLAKHGNRWEAAKSLNERHRLGLKFDGFNQEKAEEINSAYELLDGFCEDACGSLLSNEKALAWLREKKGITIEDVKQYWIGYVGAGQLARKLKGKQRGLAIKLGLVVEKDGKSYDYFRNRILFSILNRGRIVGIWGREFPEKKGGIKYLGLPCSELLPHKAVAFVENLNCKLCVVTESISDSIAFNKVDIPSCSPIGTNISQYQSAYFERAKARLYFLGDPDSSGESASYKWARQYKGYIADLRQGTDADEALAQLGVERFKELAEKAVTEARYYLDVVYEREPVLECLKEILRLGLASEQELELKKLAVKLGITLGALREDFKRLKQEAEAKSEPEPRAGVQKEPIDLLAESKPSLHPAMDVMEGKLCMGTSGGANSVIIYDRQVLPISEVEKNYQLTGMPDPLRFSINGIKAYNAGAEVRGPELYKRVYQLLSKYIVFKKSWQIVVAVIWIIATYLHRCFDLFPYLWIQSPTKRCGKTLFLEILAELCFNSKGVETAPTEAVLFREAAITAGALCWDEAEGLSDAKHKGERNSILNVSFRKGGKVSRCEGDEHTVRDFEVYRPIVLAGISALPDTAADRSLKIELMRKRKDEKVERMKLRRLRPELQSLRDALHIFALERAPKIMAAYEDFTDDLMPAVIDDRLRDIFEVLFAVVLGLFCYDKEQLPSILTALEEAAKALTGVRSVAEGDVSFIQAIKILKLELDKARGEPIILKSDEAVRLFQSQGIEWVVEPKHARGLLRKMGFFSASHRQKDDTWIRGYEIAPDKVDDLFERYGTKPEEGE